MQPAPDRDFDADVAILGAGPVGCALALALHDDDLRVVLVGHRAATPAPEDGSRPFRPLALSYASRLILERIGAWRAVTTSPIEQIHVSQSGGFGRTRISRDDLALPALGYVTDYAQLAAALLDLVPPSRRWPADKPQPRARLVVHAEGLAGADAVEKAYGHCAIVAAVECEPVAGSTAWERFTPEGPLALLPLGARYGVVWSRSSERAPEMIAMQDAQFLAALQSAFGRRAGRFLKASARTSSNLVLRYRSKTAAPGEVHVGNAAQTLHPVAGQGLNLGLRDAWDLAEAIRAWPRDTLGGPAFAEKFARGRRLDARATIGATDLLATLYTRRDPIASVLRGVALATLDVIPPARRAFARRMVFGASAW